MTPLGFFPGGQMGYGGERLALHRRDSDGTKSVQEQFFVLFFKIPDSVQ